MLKTTRRVSPAAPNANLAKSILVHTSEQRGPVVVRSLHLVHRVASVACQKLNPQIVEAVLCTKVKAHDSSLTSACVFQDNSESKQIVTASLDKTVASWKLLGSLQEGPTGNGQQLEFQKVAVEGAPVFCFQRAQQGFDSAKLCGDAAALYLGTAAKEVVAWVPATGQFVDKLKLDGHTGWVRALATSGKWLFSCGCNYLRQWDTSYPVPKLVSSTKLFTGDILSLAAGNGKIFTAGADGSLRSWAVSSGSAAVEQKCVQEKAHQGRVSALLVVGKTVISSSFDGSIKVWDADSLALLAEVVGAHDGLKVHCLAVGPDKMLYSGGGDKLIRRWNTAALESIGEPLFAHEDSVRVLAAGALDCLVSGDAAGNMCIWKIGKQ